MSDLVENPEDRFFTPRFKSLPGYLAEISFEVEWWVGATRDLDAGGEWVWSTGEPWSDEIDLLTGNYE